MLADKVYQSIEIFVGYKIHIAPLPAVAAVWTALGDELFPAEADTSVTAVSGFDLDFCLVNKHFLVSRRSYFVSRYNKKRMAKIPSFFISGVISFCQTTWIFRPWKRTVPSAVANNVKSLPMPTLEPGKNFVPHCRTIIEPVLTVWPPNVFTPLYFGLPSLPFFVEPCPFLCAIVSHLCF
jgi:hypothetical protein